jgi:hypothetical protein
MIQHSNPDPMRAGAFHAARRRGSSRHALGSRVRASVGELLDKLTIVLYPHIVVASVLPSNVFKRSRRLFSCDHRRTTLFHDRRDAYRTHVIRCDERGRKPRAFDSVSLK